MTFYKRPETLGRRSVYLRHFWQFAANAMVTNHLRAPYGVYFTKNRTILLSPYGARPAAGRIVRFFIIFLDIVQCPVKFRYYLKFRTAPVRRLHTSDGHRTIFCLKFISYDSNGARPDTVRCPAGHSTMSDKRRELSNISEQIVQCHSGHRTMPVQAPVDVLWVELPPVRSDVILQKNILHILQRYM